MKSRAVARVADLPTHSFDAQATSWWGTIGFIAIEATAFAAAVAAYYYLMHRNDVWPPAAAPPALLPATICLAILLVSLWPNHLMSKAAHRHDKAACQRLLIVMSLLGCAALVARAFEFGALGVRWNDNAYGSIVWVIVGLHTLHLATDVVETTVLAALMFTRHGHGKRFSDVSDDAFYWWFIALSWALLYGVVYLTPRL